jgi:aminopeptidase-like protein
MKTIAESDRPRPAVGLNLVERAKSLDLEDAGGRMHRLVAELYPICRSITGHGLRETLRILGERIPIERREIASGTAAFDWTIPNEWNIRDAWVKNEAGEKVIDFSRSNLHVVNYSVPVHTRLDLSDLRSRLYTLPEKPDWIPYRTTYYKEDWGFCLAHNELARLEEGKYEVCIDSRLEPGSLSYGECFLPGDREAEILISCHACHPSLCNDNLSGVVLAAELARLLAEVDRVYSYRFLFIPGTIGSIAWLAQNEDRVSAIHAGLVVACVGDAGSFHYKKSRMGNSLIDRAVVCGLGRRPEGLRVLEYSPYGYDERQYCSPGFNLPVGVLSRTPHGCYEQYHTSADNLDFVTPSGLAGSFDTYVSVLSILECNRRCLNRNPKCEPQLGRRGLYRALGGLSKSTEREMAMLWTLNLSDGSHTLLDIAERSGMPFGIIDEAARLLEAHGLLAELEPEGGASVPGGPAATP